MAASHTLQLEDLAPERTSVELPGYGTAEILDPRELSFYDRAELQRIGERLAKLNDKLSENPTEARADELARLYRDLVGRALPDVPEEVVAKLAPYHLDQIGGYFLGQYGTLVRRIIEPMGLPETLTETPPTSTSDS